MDIISPDTSESTTPSVELKKDVERTTYEKLQSVEVPVEATLEIAKELLEGVELLSGATLKIRSRKAGETLFSMKRGGGSEIYVPSEGDRQLLPVLEGKETIRSGFLRGLLGVYLKCQRTVNLGGVLPGREDPAEVNDSRKEAISVMVEVIVASLDTGDMDISREAIAKVDAYVNSGYVGPLQGTEKGENVIVTALDKMMPFLREVVAATEEER